jgi:threonine dehydratase
VPLFDLKRLNDAAEIVRAIVPRTPSYEWPLLSQRTGATTIVKHENHTPTGSFKARGGLTYIEALRRSGSLGNGVITATRGNHGQSIALGARRAGVRLSIVVPEGNSSEKNAAMLAFGGELSVAGRDFDESRAIATQRQAEQGLHYVPSFHPDLVVGVATYAYELFEDCPNLDSVFAPIGMGSGICGLITVRDLLGLSTEIIGVVSEHAPAFALSYGAGRVIRTDTAITFADGLACRDPQPEALHIVGQGASRIVRVSDDEIAEAIRAFYTDTHNIAEGAGAAALAALIKERESHRNRRVAVILTGGNMDMALFAEILNGRTPKV